jgi:hypothetical protein
MEVFSLNKTIKRIVALGTGAAMLGATVLGAMAAADLSAYPKPIVDAGKFNGLIVVGSKAIASDVVGSIEIATSLQAANTVTKTLSGTTETVVEGGQKIESSSTKLYLEHNLYGAKATFTKSEFPTLLKPVTITDDEGTEYTYDTLIKNPEGFAPTFGTPGDLESPILYLETASTPVITVEMTFNKKINFSEVTGKEFEIFGKTYTISDLASEVTATLLTLYSTALDQTFEAGSAETTVTVGGKEVKVTVIGVSTGTAGTATIKVNGETKSVESGHSYTLGGQKIYVKDVMAYDQPIGGGAVRLFLGSDKIQIDATDNIVKKISSTGGETEIEGVSYTGDDFDALSEMSFTITPSLMDPEVEYVDKEFVEPLFGAFKYQFTGANPALESAERGTIKIQPDGTTKIKVAFTNRDGQAVTVSPIKYDGLVPDAFGYEISGKTLQVTNTAIADEEYFILNVDGYTYILQLKDIDATDGVTLRNFVTGDPLVQIIKSGHATFSFHGNDVIFDVVETTSIDLSADETATIGSVFYTADGAGITMDLGTESLAPTITVEETADALTWMTFSAAAELHDSTIVSTWSYDTEVKSDDTDVTLEQFGETDNYAGLTAYGTYVKHNSDTYVTELRYYEDITNYGVYVAPVGATTTTGGSNTYQEMQKIEVGAAVLDTEVADYTAQNLIVVGGPCANTVAASLMGNPADCAAGFEQGKAIIKLFENNGKVAVLVAGYSDMDTRRASRVLAGYTKYSLSGAEMQVVGTSLTDITVSKPATV